MNKETQRPAEDTSWFPIEICYLDTKETVVVKTPYDIRKGSSFKVLRLNVKPSV